MSHILDGNWLNTNKYTSHLDIHEICIISGYNYVYICTFIQCVLYVSIARMSDELDLKY